MHLDIHYIYEYNKIYVNRKVIYEYNKIYVNRKVKMN
jgi:hypothetical protein